MRNLIFLSLLIFCLTASGCQLNENCSSEGELEITLPAWPPEQEGLTQSYPPLSRWKIIISSAGNQSVFYTKEKTITMKIRKNHPACLTATPITLLEKGGECCFFKPAGYIYPDTGSSGTGSSPDIPRATWEEGFLADTMQRLFQEGERQGLPPIDIEYLISTFNWKKSRETIEKKLQAENQTFYNPWLLSQTAIINGICSRSFKTNLFNTSGTATVNFTDLGLSQTIFSSFIPENQSIIQKKQFTVLKNTPILVSDTKKYGFFIIYKSSKNISLEYIFMPIYIGDI